MKKTLPVLLGVLFGCYAVIEYFIPQQAVRTISSHVFEWGGIVAASAYVIGGVNLVQVTWPKIRRREHDWQYKIVLLASAGIMAVVGLPWRCVLGDSPPGAIAIVGTDPEAAARNKVVARLVAPDDVVFVIGLVTTTAKATPRLELDPGPHTIKAGRRVVGYEALNEPIVTTAGQVLEITADPQMEWGTNGRVRTWIYNYIFAPCNATMFALLAFFVASAAFRAFRARNLEAGLLLGSAIIVLLARAPIGRAIAD
nr:hypothetical protein [Deltaproteobacteria bacterium]